jgi:hypothetical protein
VTLGNHSGGNANAFYLPMNCDATKAFNDWPICCFVAVKVNASAKKKEAFFDLGSSVICREHANDKGCHGTFIGGGFNGDLVIVWVKTDDGVVTHSPLKFLILPSEDEIRYVHGMQHWY